MVGCERDVYHKPRLTAWKREELRERKAERKAVQKAAQEIVAKRDTSQPQPPMPSIDELARRAAYGELEMLQETITDEIVTQYGWSDADVLFLKGFGSICVVLAVHGEPPYPIRVTDEDSRRCER